MGWSSHLTALAWSSTATSDGGDGTKRSRAISTMQLFPAVLGRFLSWGHAGCLSAEAGSGQRPELALALSPWHLCSCHRHGKGPGQGDVKGRHAGVQGDPAQGGCLQALAVSNVAAHKWKQLWVKNSVFVSFVVFLAVPGLGASELRTVFCQKLNMSLEIKMLHWNIRSVLQIYLSRKVSRDSLWQGPRQDLGYHVSVIICLDSASRY